MGSARGVLPGHSGCEVGADIAYTAAGLDGDSFAGGQIAQCVPGGGAACGAAFGGDVVHQIVDMDHVAAGEDAAAAGLHLLVHGRSVGDGVNGNAGGPGQFVLRNQTHGEQQGITGDTALCFRDGTALIVHLCDAHTHTHTYF